MASFASEGEYPERSRADTRSRSRDGTSFLQLEPAGNRRSTSELLETAELKEFWREAVASEELLSVFGEGDDRRVRFTEREEIEPPAELVDLARMSELTIHGNSAQCSHDYLLALSAADSQRQRSTSSERMYDDMLALLQDDDLAAAQPTNTLNKKKNKKKNNKAPAAAAATTCSSSAPPALAQRKSLSSSPDAAAKPPLPILPKPPACSRGDLARRLESLRDSGSVTRAQHDQATRVLESADDFILRHLDDALVELESSCSTQQQQADSSSRRREKQRLASSSPSAAAAEEDGSEPSKLTLLLDIYTSLNLYLAPIATLQQQIHDKTRLAVKRRSQRRDADAVNLMRQVKNLEHNLQRLRDDLATHVGLPAQPDDDQRGPVLPA